MARSKKMPKAKTNIAVAAQARLLDGVHQIWLAGLGAVSRAQRGTPKLLDELVAEGARVHAKARGSAEKAVRGALGEAQSAISERIESVREQAGDAYENLEKIFQTRVRRALHQLGVPTADSLASLSKRVDALNANIDRLARTRAAPRARKAMPRARTAGAGRHAPSAHAAA